MENRIETVLVSSDRPRRRGRRSVECLDSGRGRGGHVRRRRLYRRLRLRAALRPHRCIARAQCPRRPHFIACDPPGGEWLDFHSFTAAAAAAPPPAAVAPDDECNIIYSSGTTALPKGIVHTHACRMRWATEAAIALRYRSGCRTLCSLGLFSNISWVAMLATILVGGTIVLMRSFGSRAALALIETERVTHGAFVPVQLERMLADPQHREFRTASLETIMCCGSPLPAAVKLGFAREFDCNLIELYGLTKD